MREQWLQVELLDNVVVSADSATEGGHRCLDYLPGAVFLGASAAKLYADLQAEVFLRGRVRFDAALPLSRNRKIGFPVPLSYHVIEAAGGNEGEWELVDGLSLTDEKFADLVAAGKKPRQLREGYITVDGEYFTVLQGQVAKTATDRELFDRPAQARFFHYRYLVRGQRFVTRVEADDRVGEENFARIIEVLTGDGLRFGRSRSAEFSRARVFPIEKPDKVSVSPADVGDSCCYYYLLSDLALYHQGVPSLRPRPADFGLDDNQYRFLPEKSFLRRRRYSPWNGFRRCRDPERQVLVRGSVIALKRENGGPAAGGAGGAPFLAAGIGAYRQEGLGRVLRQPGFVVKPPEKLVATGPFPVAGGAGGFSPPRVKRQELEGDEKILADCVHYWQRSAAVANRALKLGRQWAADWWNLQCRLGAAAPGKSQWGEVRKLTQVADGSRDQLLRLLFDPGNGFCCSDRRQRMWQAAIRLGGRELSLAGEIRRRLQSAAGEEMLAVLAVYYAAREMGRRLGK